MSAERNPQTSAVQVIAAIGLVLATPVASWWVMDVIATSEQLLDPDYAFRPIPMDPTTKLLIGVTAVTFVVAAVFALVLTDPDWHFVRRWWTVVAPLLAVGAICGGGWAAMTAPVIGANIGAGLVLLGAPPVVVALLIWAPARWWWLLTRPSEPPEACATEGASGRVSDRAWPEASTPSP